MKKFVSEVTVANSVENRMSDIEVEELIESIADESSYFGLSRGDAKDLAVLHLEECKKLHLDYFSAFVILKKLTDDAGK